MRSRCFLAWLLMAALVVPVLARGSSHHGGMGSSHPIHSGGGHWSGNPPVRSTLPPILGGVGAGGWGWYGQPYYGTLGPYGPIYFGPTFVQQSPVILPLILDRAAVGGPMPANGGVGVPVRRVKRVDPAKVNQLVLIGDRLFRAGNLPRAAQRYEQALRADPDAAAPRARMAQVEMVRGHFKESAQQLRDAIAADPRWLASASDVQTLFAEPADFHRQISRLESHVLIDPGDRDAWLVLGAELFLSGQTRRASDIFVRLSDRKPDPALAAFLDATQPAEDAPK